MCTIMTVDIDSFTDNVVDQIAEDAKYNPHGFALALFKEGELVSLNRTTDFSRIVDALYEDDWDRMFLHCRYATWGDHLTENCHGWISNGHLYMHNGILENTEAYTYAVDSMLIGQWLSEGGVETAIAELREESYANVFIMDLQSRIFSVSRSFTNTLFTDGNGNFSTNKVDSVSIPVPTYSVVACAIDPVAEIEGEYFAEGSIPEDGLTREGTSATVANGDYHFAYPAAKDPAPTWYNEWREDENAKTAKLEYYNEGHERAEDVDEFYDDELGYYVQVDQNMTNSEFFAYCRYLVHMGLMTHSEVGLAPGEENLTIRAYLEKYDNFGKSIKKKSA